MATRVSSSTSAAASINSDDSPAEHVIVGVDIGYTCTGVAISSVNRTPNDCIKPFPIQQWPGSDTPNAPGAKTYNKVPTLITYKAGDLRAGSWGFACPSPSRLLPGMTVKGLFKFLLDPRYLEEVNMGKSGDDQESIENVKKWFTDFLAKLHDHIVSHLEDPVWNVDWGFTKVEYHFSLPTSWESNGILVEDVKEIVKNAGFGSWEHTTVAIGMTEAAASAVYTAKTLGSKFKEGDVVLVCDAGGGTTDLCVLKVTKVDHLTVELNTIEEMSIFVGSVQIDEEFEALLEKKLEANKLREPEWANDTTLHDDDEETPSEQFEKIKLGWGIRKPLSIRRFSLPGFSGKVRVEFSSTEINTMFDNQIERIIVEIDKMLGNLRNMQLDRNVTSLVLAGGLGSSTYVQSKLRARYDPQGMKLLVETNPEEPPLSVCRGLVLDRVQRIMHGTSVLRTRRCRASYGIAFREIYNKTEHRGRDCVKDPIDGKKYVEGYIRWFILKGDIIQEGFERAIPHVRVASFQNPATAWEDVVVTSRYESNSLPKYLDQGDCREVCKISSTSQPGSLIPRRKYLAIGKRFLYGTYEVWGSVEHEHLKFETRVNGVLVGSGQTTGVPWEYSEK